MNKHYFIIFLICVLRISDVHAQISVRVNKKTIDSLYYRNTTHWITLTPFFLVKQEFSPDEGQTWEKVGMLGGNVKPYLVSDSIAVQNINLYKYIRLAGIVQMWVLSPLLAYRHYTLDPNNIANSDNNTIDAFSSDAEREQGGGYLTASIIVFCTGTLTYHVLSKTYLYRALHDYNRGILQHTGFANASFNLNVKVDSQTQIPQFSLIITF